MATHDINQLMQQQGVRDAAAEAESRKKIIVKTSITGIAANVFLAAFKAAVGLLTHSIAIVLDAVNNISDAASSLITIVGAKLAGKKPDRKHPFGHGRIEYLSAMVISVIVLYAGITSFVESIKKIITPQTPDYSVTALIIVAVGVLVKILLGLYVRKKGESVNSDSLVNSGKDALLDSVISASTLVAAIIFIKTGLSLEAWLGAAISVLIIKSGLEMLKDTLSQILGEGADAETAREIKKTVLSYPDVSGVYDLVLNNYGPDTYNGSLHIEVPDTYSADMLDELIRQISIEVYLKHKVVLTAIGVYSVNTKDENVFKMREEVRKLVFSHEYVTQMHGFYVNNEKKTMRFDVVISLDAPDRDLVYGAVMKDVAEKYPDHQLQITMDTDFTDE